MLNYFVCHTLGLCTFVSEMLKLWQFKNFAIGNFLVSQVGLRKNSGIITKRYSGGGGGGSNFPVPKLTLVDVADITPCNNLQCKKNPIDVGSESPP